MLDPRVACVTIALISSGPSNSPVVPTGLPSWNLNFGHHSAAGCRLLRAAPQRRESGGQSK